MTTAIRGQATNWETHAENSGALAYNCCYHLVNRTNSANLPNEVTYFSRRYNDMVNVLDIDESEWNKYVKKLYRRNLK